MFKVSQGLELYLCAADAGYRRRNLRNPMDLNAFAIQLREETFAAREVEGSEEFAENAFVSRVLAMLSEAGEIDDAEVIRYKSHGSRINGYVLDVEGETLDLFIALYTGDVSARTTDKSQGGGVFRHRTGS